MVYARGLVYAAGGRLIVRGVSVVVGAGECLLLVGPNGAGKSTLLRLFARLRTPTGGSLAWFGGESDPGRVRRRIGFVGHDTYLYGHLTGRENLAYYAALQRVAGAPSRVAEVLERVGLGRVADAPVRTYSRGMAQRLSLARALVHRPDLLLLDEPESGLDPRARVMVGEILTEARRRGAAVVLAAHDLEFAFPLAERALLLARGRLLREVEGGVRGLMAVRADFPGGAVLPPARLDG